MDAEARRVPNLHREGEVHQRRQIRHHPQQVRLPIENSKTERIFLKITLAVFFFIVIHFYFNINWHFIIHNTIM